MKKWITLIILLTVNMGYAAEDTYYVFTGKGSGTEDSSEVVTDGVTWDCELTPPQLTGDVDNFTPTGIETACALRIHGGGSARNITGLGGGVDGKIITIHNIGTLFSLVLKDASSSSLAANRFILDADKTIVGDSSITVRYDGVSGGWRLFSVGGAAPCVENDTAACELAATRSSSDADFTAANIKNGTNILNVTGTYSPTEAWTSITNSYTGSTDYNETVTTGAANTKGSWTELIASTSSNAVGFWFAVSSTSVSSRYLCDVGTGAAAAETAILNNIMLHNGEGVSGGAADYTVYIPLTIASGTRISVRCQSDGATKNFNLAILPVHGAAPLTTFTSSVTYGAGTTSTTGTQIDPGGTANTKGSYTEITASTTATTSYMLLMIGGKKNSAPAAANFRLDVATGGAGSETVLFGDIYLRSDANPPLWIPAFYYFPVSIASGTRLSVRAQSTTNDATDRLFDVQIITFN